MTDRPIIFSGAMVRALLDGRKTQTRRLASSPLARCAVGDRLWVRETVRAEELSRPPINRAATPRERKASGRTHVVVLDDLDGTDVLRYAADDRWARIPSTSEAGEAWSAAFHYGQRNGARPSGVVGKGIPSIHMPRWASRLTLTVTDVRQQPLGAISDEDAIAEGARFTDFGRYQPPGTASFDGGATWHPFGERQHNGWHVTDVSRPEECLGSASAAFANLWNSLHDKPGERWADNPTIVALTFTVAAGNIDRIAA